MSKPDFALTLSFEGIGLLLRNGTVWNRVGDVPLDVSDLSKALDVLRKTASDLSDSPLHVKLVLPDEQIKYLRITDPGGGREVQEAAVKAALDGATPYGLDELSYDWSELKGELTIAAVAYETLEEAETFACENGFEPVYFAAAPEAGTFSGEPYFGETEFARTHADKIGQVERDTQAIVVDGVARPPAPEQLVSRDNPATPAPVEDTIVSSVSSEPDELASKDAAHERKDSATASSSETLSVPPAPVAFASRRTDDEENAAPTLTGVTRHEPIAATPSITPGPVDVSETFPAEPEGTEDTHNDEHRQPNPGIPVCALSSEPLMERATESLREPEEDEPESGAMSFFSRRAKPRGSSEGPAIRVPRLRSAPPATATAPPAATTATPAPTTCSSAAPTTARNWPTAGKTTAAASSPKATTTNSTTRSGALPSASRSTPTGSSAPPSTASRCWARFDSGGTRPHDRPSSPARLGAMSCRADRPLSCRSGPGRTAGRRRCRRGGSH